MLQRQADEIVLDEAEADSNGFDHLLSVFEGKVAYELFWPFAARAFAVRSRL